MKNKIRKNLILWIGLLAFTGCYKWEGRVFYQLQKDMFEGTEYDLSLSAEGSCLTHMRFFGLSAKAPITGHFELEDCAPFLIADRYRARYGRCLPQSMTLRDSKGFYDEYSYRIHLNMNCLCYTEENLSVKSDRQSDVKLTRAFGSISDCAPFFNEKEIEQYQEAIEGTYEEYGF